MERQPPAVDRFPVGASATLGELDRDPHPLLARLRATEPVSWLPVLDGWLVTRRDLARAVMRDAGTYTVDDPRFSTAQVVGASMLSLDGPEHARHREPFAGAFRPEEVAAALAGPVEAEASRLVAALEPHGRAELRRDLAGPLAVAVVARSLGLVDVDGGTILGWFASIASAVAAITGGEAGGGSGAVAFREFRKEVEATIRRAPGSVLARVARLGPLSVDDVVSDAAVLMFGGIETTEAMIANAVLHLLQSPSQLASVRADPALAGPAVEESLRLEPAAAVVDRYAAADVALAGVHVRRGDLVRVSISAANRDPAVFAEPDRFDVRRDNARLHLAFAHGPHACLGAALARLEAAAAVRCLLERLPALRLDPRRPSQVRGLVFRKPPTLHVLFRATARRPRAARPVAV